MRHTGKFVSLLQAQDGSPLRQDPALYQDFAAEWNKERSRHRSGSLYQNFAAEWNKGRSRHRSGSRADNILVILLFLPLGFSIGCVLSNDTTPECRRAEGLAVFGMATLAATLWWRQSRSSRPAGSQQEVTVIQRLQDFLDRVSDRPPARDGLDRISNHYRLELRQVRPSKRSTLQPDYLFFVRRQRTSATTAAKEKGNDSNRNPKPQTVAEAIAANRDMILGLVEIDSSLVTVLECIPHMGRPELWHDFCAELQDLAEHKKRADRIVALVVSACLPLAFWLWGKIPLTGWFFGLAYTCLVLCFFWILILGRVVVSVADNYAFLVKERLFAMTKRHWNNGDHICGILDFDVAFANLLGPNRVFNLLCISRREERSDADGGETGQDGMAEAKPPADIRAMPQGENFELYGTPNAGRQVGLWDLFHLPLTTRERIFQPWLMEAKMKEKEEAKKERHDAVS